MALATRSDAHRLVVGASQSVMARTRYGGDFGKGTGHPVVCTDVVAMIARLVIASAAIFACCAAPLGSQPVVLDLQIDNPERLSLTLDLVDGDQCRQLAALGAAGSFRLQLLPGAYVVRATTKRGAMAVAAPLLPMALLPATVLRVSVCSPPAGAELDPDFAFVPAGPAVIGDTLGIGQEDERPARIVEVPAFWLGRREVTNAEFAAFLTAVEPAVDPQWCAFDSRKCRVVREPATGRWTTAAPTLPVVTVSLAGALAYCAYWTRRTGLRHRLPTEVEWEKAARGPASLVYAYGNVYRRMAANQESGALRAVAATGPEGFGLYDMTGNAFEWTSDAYVADPAGHLAPDDLFQVLRGGSFVLDGMYLRNSFRMKQRPEVRTDDIGFRVAHD